MRTLVFEQVVDSRFDENARELMRDIVGRIDEILSSLEGVRYEHDPIRKLTFDDDNSYQYRCLYIVQKEGRKVTWNDVYKKVNSVKAPYYEFKYIPAIENSVENDNVENDEMER